jgi:hypothetical protein
LITVAPATAFRQTGAIHDMCLHARRGRFFGRNAHGMGLCH